MRNSKKIKLIKDFFFEINIELNNIYIVQHFFFIIIFKTACRYINLFSCVSILSAWVVLSVSNFETLLIYKIK
jgi:hypothetical protein